ncbi:MAG: DUF4332 domain-containing protein [Desulfobacterales bacterium]|nr:DUF4332 domain-containing protein [Desulfobacterales bacterium]
MADDYYIDLEKITLDDYNERLEKTYIVKSRKILKENTCEKFKILKDYGIKNLQDCLSILKTKDNVKEFAEKSGLSEEYLTILKREINSFKPNPLNFNKIPDITSAILKKLEKMGIKNTRKLFNKIKTKEDRKEFSEQSGISVEDLLELVKLTDLSRVKWIGPIFSRLFYESGVDTVNKMTKAEPKELFIKLIEINKKNNYTKANFTENDVMLCIDVSKDVPQAIEY